MNYNKVSAIIGLLALTAGMSSCVEESGLLHTSDGIQLRFSAEAENEMTAKASLDGSWSFVWETGDELGLFIDNADTPTVNAKGTASVNDGKSVYSATVNDYAAGNRLYAYYPYAAGAERDENKVRLSIEPVQSQKTAGVLNGKNFPMVAVPYTFVSSAAANEEPCLHFKHLSAFVEFDVYAAEEAFVGEKVQSVELRTQTTIAGAFQFDYTTAAESQDFSVIAGASSTVTVTLDESSPVTSSTGTNKIYMALKPGKYQASVKVTTDRGIYLFQIPEQAAVFERAYVRRLALGLRTEKQIYKSTLEEYTGNYIREKTNTYPKVYFDFETASNYAEADAKSSADRKKTDLVLFNSSSLGLCFAAPACSDLTYVKDDLLNCYSWNTEEKNKTKIKLLTGFTAEDYAALTPAEIESLTEGWENLNDAAYHRQNGVAKDTYYGFKTVQMDADGNVTEVVSAGVMKITGVNKNTGQKCVIFDYKISRSSSTLDAPAVVSVSDRKLLVDGEEFVVKGVAGNSFANNPASIGANTVRLYNMTTATLAELGYALDEAWMNGLKVCVGIYMFPWNQNGDSDFYNNNYESGVAKVRTHVKNVVGTYKNHPAVLMWCLGNECEAAYDGSENLENDHHMWSVMNEFAAYVKERDPNHPVATCVANAANVKKYIQEYCGNLDLLLVNSYGSAITNLPNHLTEWPKPFVVGEFGPAGTWQMHDNNQELPWLTSAGNKALIELTSTQKAEGYATAWNNVMSTGATGGFAFQWGYQTHGEVLTWFGMHDKMGRSFGVTDELQKLWTGAYPSVVAPVIADRDKMQMNGKRADEGVTVTSSQDCTAYVVATSPSGASLTYEWRIIEEGTSAEDGSFPDGISDLIAEHDPSAHSISFKAPSSAGAYRLYVFACDEATGKVASACIPFQVTE